MNVDLISHSGSVHLGSGNVRLGDRMNGKSFGKLSHVGERRGPLLPAEEFWGLSWSSRSSFSLTRTADTWGVTEKEGGRNSGLENIMGDYSNFEISSSRLPEIIGLMSFKLLLIRYHYSELRA